MDVQQWGPPAAVLAIGLAVGVWRALGTRTTPREQGEVAAAGRRVDHEQARDAALEALRALELERDKLDPDDYTRQRHELLSTGAAALRALEETRQTSASEAAIQALEAERGRLGDAAVDAALAALRGGATARPGAPPAALSPAWQGAAWALAAVALVAGFLWYAQQNTAARPTGAPMTGRAMEASAGPATPATPADDPEAAALQARLAANPTDIEALNGLTEFALGQEDLGTAMAMNSRALAVDPTDKEARVYLAFLRTAIGQGDIALTELDVLLAEDPTYTKALVYKGLIAMITDQPGLAIEPLERALAGEAAGNPFLEERLATARARASGAPDPAAPPHPMPMPTPAPAGGGAALVVSGTATLPAALASQLSGTEVLYVSVRDPGGGPPLAALKLPPGPFPVAFTVTTADAIAMGGARPFPDRVNVSVRIDTDGNPMTKSDAEPLASRDGVALGSSDLTFDLR